MILRYMSIVATTSITVIVLMLLAMASGTAKEDAYIQFPDGSLVENPFHPNFFEPETDPQNIIPPGFANPKQSVSALVDESDPAGLGTSCNLYQGELDLVKTLITDYGITQDQALRCLDLMNTAGIVISNQFAEKDKMVSEKHFIENIEKLKIPHGEKLKYKRVVRDTIRAIKNGKVKVNAYNGNYKDEEDRNQLFVGVISDCVHSYIK